MRRAACFVWMAAAVGVSAKEVVVPKPPSAMGEVRAVPALANTNPATALQARSQDALRHPSGGEAAPAESGGVSSLKTPRDFYNLGTRELKAGKLREAEASLQTAVSSQEEKVQVAALYNLGHVRFKQGAEALQKAPDAGEAGVLGQAACAATDRALQMADEALNGYDLDALVAAYIHGRGVRKQIKTATEAVKKALEEHGAVLARWQRASGDFKSSFELRANEDARFNAELVDKQIAKLVDREKMLNMAMQSCSKKKESLQGKLGEMKKRIPKDKLKQCQNGEEDDEEEEEPKQPKPGQQEPKPQERDGRERLMSPEEAARLLQALKLDANRKLPMGFEKEAKPKDRVGRDW